MAQPTFTTLDAAKIIAASMFHLISPHATAGEIREATSLAAAEIMLKAGGAIEIPEPELEEPAEPTEPEAPAFNEDRR